MGAGVSLSLFRRLVTGPSHDLHFTARGLRKPGASRLAKAASSARNAAALVVPGPDGSSLATLRKSLQFSDTNDLMLKGVQRPERRPGVRKRADRKEHPLHRDQQAVASQEG